MANNLVDIGTVITQETEKRLEIMKSPDYKFPEKAGKKDAIAIILAIAVCGLLILGCMTGVIV